MKRFVATVFAALTASFLLAAPAQAQFNGCPPGFCSPKVVAPAGDPYFANVILLLPLDGANGSTSGVGLQDFSSFGQSTGGAGGTSHIDTSTYAFGGSSFVNGGLFGTTIYNSSSVWDTLSTTSANPYTIEFWGRVTGYPVDYRPAFQVSFPDIKFSFGITPAGEMQFFYTTPSSVGVSLTTSGLGLSTNTWYAFAVDKNSSGKIRIYVDGVMKATSTPADSAMVTFSDGFKIAPANGGSGALWPGWVDEIRITRNIARYNSDAGYTVTTTAFPLF
jgi:hypothetical protein